MVITTLHTAATHIFLRRTRLAVQHSVQLTRLRLVQQLVSRWNSGKPANILVGQLKCGVQLIFRVCDRCCRGSSQLES